MASSAFKPRSIWFKRPGIFLYNPKKEVKKSRWQVGSQKSTTYLVPFLIRPSDTKEWVLNCQKHHQMPVPAKVFGHAWCFSRFSLQNCKKPLELTIPFKTVHHPEFQEALQWADASAHTHKKGHICISGGETLHSWVGTAHHTWHNGYTAAILRSPVARAGKTWLDFLLQGLDSSSLKTSLRSEWLSGEQARLNSNPAEKAEMWEGGILQDNQGQGSTQHKQCFKTHRQRILQLSLSAEGVGRYQNCS